MGDFVLKVDGFCPVCEQQTTFGAKDAWLRDHFLCLNCNSQPRERALFSVLTQLRPDWRKLKIHESSPGTAASTRLADQAPGYLASQYDPSIPWGSVHPSGGWRSASSARKASTQSGSKCLPRPSSRKRQASSRGQAFLYGRSEVRASKTSATAVIRP